MFIDIAFNVTSKHYKDNYNEVIESARTSRIMPIFVGLDVYSSQKCLLLAKKYNTCCYVGIHPLSTINMNISELKLAFDFTDPNIAGIGECGLDFHRSNDKNQQLDILNEHLDIEALPYFYHCRSASKELADFLKNKKNMYKYKGVVHSFDGKFQEAMHFIEKGLFIGINGCSLKTEENLDVLSRLPINKILVETDSPYCLIRNSYAGSKHISVTKNGYNKPHLLVQIVEVISKVKDIPLDILEVILFENTLEAFPNIKKFVKFWDMN